jgi:predicted ABC-type ATPase
VTPVPTLVVVSGPAGAGKTTLAHEIARAVGCPAICRDEIKEGMAHRTPGFVPEPDAGQRVTACLTRVRPKSHIRPLPRCALSMTSANASQNSFTSASVMFSGGSSLITSV